MAETNLNQYLTFRLSEETFGIEISKIHEVLEVPAITRMPQMPDYACGVINLREKAVCVLDLRLTLGMSQIERSVNTCIIITEIQTDNGVAVIGNLVDNVQEVIELNPDDIEPVPEITGDRQNNFIKGIGKQEDEFIIILDMDKVVALHDAVEYMVNKREQIIHSPKSLTNREILEKIVEIEERLIRMEERISNLEKEGLSVPQMSVLSRETGEMINRKKAILSELIKDNLLIKRSRKKR